jgi:predicted Zn-dependent protease
MNQQGLFSANGLRARIEANRRRLVCFVAALVAGAVVLTPPVRAQLGLLDFDLFSVDQEIELGKQGAQKIEKENQLLNEPWMQAYIARLGAKVTSQLPSQEFPFTFKIIVEDSVNAFALPGGPVYVHSGLLRLTDNEAQLASVVAHEISHVVLHHSAKTISKAKAVELPLLLASGVLQRTNGLIQELGKMGVNLTANSFFLTYSRYSEREADLSGVHLLADAGYDPMQMAEFMESLAQISKQRTIEFFSSHPRPENRRRYIQEEISTIAPRQYITNSADFVEMKAHLSRL